jgi:hypothetical protein
MASITLNIKSELPKAIRWTDTMTKQLPFAISQALNKTAFDMRDAMNGATRQYFKNPVPFTQRAFLVNKSNKRDLTAKVYAERRRARYLRTLISGGVRGQKPVERVVQSLAFSLALDAKAAKPLRRKGSRVASNKTIP